MALCVFRRNHEILVFQGYDSVKRETYYRPLGGGIDFGEVSRDAVVREVWEELGMKVRDVRLVGTLENVFTLEGEPRHEIVFVYLAEPIDRAFYQQEAPMVVEADGSRLKTFWKPLDAFGPAGSPLYPTGLLELLTG